MSFPSVNPTSTNAHKQLKEKYASLRSDGLLHLFEKDEDRFKNFSVALDGVLYDYSKQYIDETSRKLLLQFAVECNFPSATEAFFNGEKINATEGRSVMHMALRSFGGLPIKDEYAKQAESMRKKMKTFCVGVHTGEIVGYSKKMFRNVVNIGIGGSDLGPAMVCEALGAYHDKAITPFFISNVDGSQLHELLRRINVEETLFLIASKTFTTQETMTNAQKVRSYVLGHYANKQEAIASHFVALSTNEEAVKGFGINPERMFLFGDWVGGRFSLWSSIGLSIALTVSYQRFQQLLEGAENIDIHFRTAAPEHNIPLLMALISFANTMYFGSSSEVILPYAQYLKRFPAYLQQVAMESNGKSVDRKGKSVAYPTCPVVWGEPGTNGQHAFYQLLHQGTSIIPADFIAFVKIPQPYDDQQQMLLAHCIAQSEGLMKGKTPEEVTAEMKAQAVSEDHIHRVAPHRVFEGGRPSSTLIFDKLDAYTLGQLIALYEHKIFVQGVLWNIYSFDQWGVELGKKLAVGVLEGIQTGTSSSRHDSSTEGLMRYVMECQ